MRALLNSLLKFIFGSLFTEKSNSKKQNKNNRHLNFDILNRVKLRKIKQDNYGF